MASSVALRRLGRELRGFRERTGRTQADVGAAIGRNQATLANWEVGKTRLSSPDLVALSLELKLEASEIDLLKRLHEESVKTNDWSGFNLSESVRPFVTMEAEASEISTFQQVLVPGLLQTEAYIRALLVAVIENASSAEIDSLVRLRMKRQQKLEDPRFHLHAIISELALMAQVGEPDEFTYQLETLTNHAQRANVTVQIVPASKSAHPGTQGSFSILRFEETAPLAYFDTPLDGNVVTNHRSTEFLAATFERLCEFALSPEKSVPVLRKALQGRKKGRSQ
ncbi:helix-turn-helix transcriptional regulator [Amycolatopsis sp. WAC 04197]|uniref:helix-turn-helix domain-containing protein n=1 Tax=Amycolatopsis sp. WAC 04197 TaxID=2203199 RepID=UPI002107249C|nr:helix-turn-helix transcriptional regulator [Amycolatopsis sp. WAC 04197]